MYVLTKKEAQDVAQLLVRQLGIAAACYHAGMSHDARRCVHMAFLRDELAVVVATVAFG